MYAVCENIYYANQVVCFPLPSISGTGAVRRSVMNIKQFLESLIWWLVYEAGKPLSANAAKHCLGWARPSSAHNAAEDGGGIFPWTASPGSPTFLTLPFLPWGTDLPCLQPSWDLWAVHWPPYLIQHPQMAFQSSREKSILPLSCGHCHLPDASPPLAHFCFSVGRESPLTFHLEAFPFGKSTPHPPTPCPTSASALRSFP